MLGLQRIKGERVFAPVYMTSYHRALAPRPSTTLETVQDTLGALVARYRQEEVLTLRYGRFPPE